MIKTNLLCSSDSNAQCKALKMKRAILISLYFVVVASFDLWRCKPADLTHRITSHMPVWPSSAMRTNRYKIEALINGSKACRAHFTDLVAQALCQRQRTTTVQFTTTRQRCHLPITLVRCAMRWFYVKCLGTHIDAPRHILEGLDVMHGLSEFSEVQLPNQKCAIC